MAKNMEEEKWHMEMGVFMKAGFLMICQMEEDAWSTPTKINTRATLKKAEKKEKAIITSLMAQYTKEHGRTTSR